MAKKRRRRMPAGLARYWATHSHRRRHRNPSRRSSHRSHVVYRTRHHNVVRYRNRYRAHNPHRRRRRNPDAFGGMNMSELVWMGGGALVNGILARSVPQMVPFLSQYNTGIMGYGLNAVTGAIGAWAIGKFVNRRAGQGAWIGLIVTLGQRIIADNFGGGSAGASGGMSGDLDMDLGYYLSDRFPYPQGSGGPYDRFPGTPLVSSPQFPVTSASAVRTGQAAAAAALPAAAAAPAVAAANTQAAGMERWGSNWS